MINYLVINTKCINDQLFFRYASTVLTCLYMSIIHTRVHIHNYAGMILYATCYKRPPALSDRFCWAGESVAQGRFYCICE